MNIAVIGSGIDVLAPLLNIQGQLKKAETFCLKLSAEVMAKKTEHFELINLHFEIDGLLATYKCAIDERTYEVKIVARD